MSPPLCSSHRILHAYTLLFTPYSSHQWLPIDVPLAHTRRHHSNAQAPSCEPLHAKERGVHRYSHCNLQLYTVRRSRYYLYKVAIPVLLCTVFCFSAFFFPVDVHRRTGWNAPRQRATWLPALMSSCRMSAQGEGGGASEEGHIFHSTVYVTLPVDPTTPDDFTVVDGVTAKGR